VQICWKRYFPIFNNYQSYQIFKKFIEESDPPHFDIIPFATNQVLIKKFKISNLEIPTTNQEMSSINEIQNEKVEKNDSINKQQDSFLTQEEVQPSIALFSSELTTFAKKIKKTKKIYHKIIMPLPKQ